MSKTRRLRVLMLSWEYTPHIVGGLGKHVQDLLQALAEQDVEVHLITPRISGGAAEEQIGDNAFVYRIDLPPSVDGNFFEATRHANTVLEEAGHRLIAKVPEFDLIHVHDWLVAFAGVALKHAYRLPLLATVHATEHGRTHGLLRSDLQRAIHNTEWWLTYESWRVICTSTYMNNEICQTLAAPIDKIDVIPNGISTRLFDCLSNRDLTEFRARFAAPDQRLAFYVGRIVAEKGIHVLIDASPLILRNLGNVRFVVSGAGPYLDDLRQRAASRSVDSHFLFTGSISDDERNRLYKVADVAVFPSLYEPFGIVALEAMAARTPLVASQVGGLTEVLDAGQAGLLVLPNSPESLAWGIGETFRNPGETARRVEHAYQKVKTQYSWSAIALRTKQLYERIVVERRRADW